MSTMLDQHCIGILFSQCYPNTSETSLHKKCWLKARRYSFAGKPAVSNMSGRLFLTLGTISLNNLGSFYSMLAREFIYELRNNNEQGPTLTGII